MARVTEALKQAGFAEAAWDEDDEDERGAGDPVEVIWRESRINDVKRVNSYLSQRIDAPSHDNAWINGFVVSRLNTNDPRVNPEAAQAPISVVGVSNQIGNDLTAVFLSKEKAQELVNQLMVAIAADGDEE